MICETITIRPAINSDIEDIWHLLHADSKNWNTEHINSQLKNLVVLIKENRMLGVLYGTLTPDKTKIHWIVIHPMYPEKVLQAVMIQRIKSNTTV